ncbi:6-phosphogluconolactonase [Psychrosphaera ytuae]|uniref:6-phosphogluconolactonase n=1 Tax=Psychrosphaera ytuae TaxID=2820710 RepID=A0A975DC17_9GAMM|nr:6-phosphogluconolactonase [Psychrosphaera ytuae]QTH64387.1 6-phosphogluconolactonase [Psychrosphaera ytuae]
MTVQLNKFDNATELNAAFAEEIAQKLTQGIEQNGAASLLVSGGNTPKALFSVLKYKDLDWSKVTIALVDDRWVTLDDPASNETMVRQNLLQENAAAAHFIGMKTSHENAFDAVSTVTTNMQNIQMPFDVVILGMGEDGHTASIFPCCAQLDEGLTTKDLILATEPTTAPHQRMTFSKAALLNSKQLYLHLVGENKEAVLNQVRESNDERKAPINAFLNQDKVPMTIMLATSK